MDKKNFLERIIKPLTTQQFRRGGYSLVLCAVVVALVVVVNLVMGALPASVTRLDITTAGLYTLDEQTRSLLANLKEDVTITYLATENSADDTILEYLERYQSASSHIKVQQVDPETNPAFVQGYSETLSNGDLIVESTKRTKIVSSSSLYTYNEEDYLAYLYGYTTDVGVQFAGEAELTTALDYVTSETLPILYALTGHGEYSMTDTWKKYLAKDNVEVRELNLLSAGSVPEDCDVLWICAPMSDYTQQEAQAVVDYLYDGGRMMLFTDYVEGGLPNFETILAAYGYTMADGFVVEGDAAHTANQQPYYLLPDITTHTVTEPTIQAAMPLLISMPQGAVQTESVRSSIDAVTLLSSSDASYSKVGGLSIETWEKQEGDLDGPFNLAMAITENYGDVDTRIVWIGTSSILEDNFDSYTGGANSDFVLNALGWMCEHESAITIRTKDFSQQYLTIDSGTALLWAGILSVVLPLAALIAGFVIWLGRRRK